MGKIVKYGSYMIFALSTNSLVGCEGKLNVDDYQNYLHEHKDDLTKTFSQNGLAIMCSYKPAELVFLQQKMNFSDVQKGDSLSESIKNIYCSLDFSINGQEIENGFLQNEQLYTACLNYLTNYVYTDVSLCTAKDTLPAIASVYARQYGATKKSSVLVVFSKGKTDLSQGFDILYRGDKFGIATVRFPFTAEAINNIPQLHD